MRPAMIEFLFRLGRIVAGNIANGGLTLAFWLVTHSWIE